MAKRKQLSWHAEQVKAYLLANDPTTCAQWGEYELSGSLADRMEEIVYNHGYEAARMIDAGDAARAKSTKARIEKEFWELAKHEGLVELLEKAWEDGLEAGGGMRENPASLARKGKRAIGQVVGWPDGSWRYDEHVDFGALAAGCWTIDFGMYVQPIAAVEGATEYHQGFRHALHEIVAAYPELYDFALSFDGPPRNVRDLLASDVPTLRNAVFMHGTSTALLPLIQRDGLRPRADTGSVTAYGASSSAREGRADAVYLTTQETMAQHAAHGAVRQFGGKPVVLFVSGVDVRRLAPDEDSRRETAEESLAVMGSVAYLGRISPDKIVTAE